jgi:hypothetical protein
MKNPKCFVQLGRLGDILNVLPLAKYHYDQTGRKPLFMAAVEFASVLEGISYIDPLLYYGPWETIHLAVFEARKLTEDIVICQIHGYGLQNNRETTSFARESWRQAGAEIPWGSVPLVFDRRDKEREQLLIQSVMSEFGKDPRPLVLFAGKGNSSPFPWEVETLEKVRKELSGTHNVVDLGNVKAERFYDLLGLYEMASCLICIDSAHQHLAAAVPKLRVVALRTREPNEWHGSPWRPQHVLSLYYDESLPHWYRICLAAEGCELRSHVPSRIIHVWADWRGENSFGKENLRRIRVAQSSWRTEYETGVWDPHEVKQSDCRRDGTWIGDPHSVQFCHDIIMEAVKRSQSDTDIIALTNSDIGFTPGLTGKIMETLFRCPAAYTHRRDFSSAITNPFVSEAETGAGEFYPGTDAFFFTVEWWKKYAGEYADFLMGREHWDEVLRQLVKYHGGCEIKNAVWHEWHESFWCGGDRDALPGNLYNDRLRQAWFAKTGLKPEDFRWWQATYETCLHPHPANRPHP